MSRVAGVGFINSDSRNYSHAETRRCRYRRALYNLMILRDLYGVPTLMTLAQRQNDLFFPPFFLPTPRQLITTVDDN